jgi:hypothetical protein
VVKAGDVSGTKGMGTFAVESRYRTIACEYATLDNSVSVCVCLYLCVILNWKV